MQIYLHAELNVGILCYDVKSSFFHHVFNKSLMKTSINAIFFILKGRPFY